MYDLLLIYGTTQIWTTSTACSLTTFWGFNYVFDSIAENQKPESDSVVVKVLLDHLSMNKVLKDYATVDSSEVRQKAVVPGADMMKSTQ